MEALRYLIHFYHSEAFLFQTVTMGEAEERAKALDALAESRAWFSGRYSLSDRADYMARRVAVERMLYTEFVSKYWPLKREAPVYLYLIPNISLEKVDRELRERRVYEENDTKYVLFDLDRISARSDITFTVDDSLRSYRRKLLDQGIPCRELTGKHTELPDYGQIYPIDELADVYSRNAHVPDLRFEVQVWDRDVLIGYMMHQNPERGPQESEDAE